MEPALGEQWSWRSWVETANAPECDFPLQNLPLCVFTREGGGFAIGAGIGGFVLDLAALASSSYLDELPPPLRVACGQPSLNALMQCGREASSLLRVALMRMLRADTEPAVCGFLERLLTPIESARFQLPVAIGDYTDFYASIHHATNVGSLFRPEQPLLPNYKYVPIGYHGRASSVVVSGHAVVRPQGQVKPASAGSPSFRLTEQLDYEVEIGAYLGKGNELGALVSIGGAEEYLFGLSLVNDWSARDIQAWEYQPLGPFLGKSFATTVSPWVVTMEALESFRVPLADRGLGDPAPLPYLSSPDPSRSAIDLTVEVHLRTEALRRAGLPAVKLSSGNLRDLYWSFGQMVTHHTSNGCNLRVGDLLASGTISGADPGTEGSLLERTRRGAIPLLLPNGEARSFLEDGDEVILRGFCEREGRPRIGLGECRGVITSASSRSS